jgi:hypothetical protein
MSTKRPAGPEDGAKDGGEPQAARIAQSVMRALGRPAEFLRVTVRTVSEGTFRVNVMTGPDLATARIAHSFFVTADGDGNLLASSPPLTRVYPA